MGKGLCDEWVKGCVNMLEEKMKGVALVEDTKVVSGRSGSENKGSRRCERWENK